MPNTPDNLTFDAPSADELEGDRTLWAMYRSSFPSNEQEPAEVIVATVREGDGLVVRARLDGQTIGFSSVHLLHGPPAAVFLVYLVVSDTNRSRGLGSQLLEETWRQAAARQAGKGEWVIGMVWEVDMPETASDETERARRRRRIAFFERLGGALLPQRYEQPPVDGIAPVPMHLMFRRGRDGPLPDATMTVGLIRSMYVEKYLRRNGISPGIIAGMIERVESENG